MAAAGDVDIVIPNKRNSGTQWDPSDWPADSSQSVYTVTGPIELYPGAQPGTISQEGECILGHSLELFSRKVSVFRGTARNYFPGRWVYSGAELGTTSQEGECIPGQS